jgi:peroxidase
MDGTGNNLIHPEYNSYNGSDEIRLSDWNYGPGDREMVTGTNPRTISNIMSSGPQKDAHDPHGVSGWGYVFGQFLDHDLDLTKGDGKTNISVAVPNGDRWLAKGTVIPMTRATYNQNTDMTINQVSGWIDASQVYGSDAATAANLRLPDGHMKTSPGNNLPTQNGQFIAGDIRVMENPELTGVTMLFVREHNFQVNRLAKLHPSWTGDQLYQEAKAIVTGELQNIIYTEFLPATLGPKSPLLLPAYSGYNPNVDPRIMQEFAFAAFRFGHSTVSDEQTRIGNQGNVLLEQTLAQAFATSTVDDASKYGGLDALLRNLGSDTQQALDPFAVDGLRNLLVAPPAAVDLIATDIQRVRDIGLGTLNQTRAALGLQPYTSFDQISSNKTIAQNLKQAYGTVDKIDLFMGGLAEDIPNDSSIGPTFGLIIAKQFQNLRDGDRYWWENQPFDPATKAMIGNTTLSQIIMRNTDTDIMQKQAFVATERHLSNVDPEDPNAPQLVIGNDKDAEIAGGPNDDTIVAGTGADQKLTGNGGSDLFVILDDGHNVTISDFGDFNTSFEQIQFVDNAAPDTPPDMAVQMRAVSGGTLLTFDGNQVTLTGVTPDQVSSKNLTFLDRNATVTNHGLVT